MLTKYGRFSRSISSYCDGCGFWAHRVAGVGTSGGCRNQLAAPAGAHSKHSNHSKEVKC
jgi:hypothetical protein